jgi:cobalamin synthase
MRWLQSLVEAWEMLTDIPVPGGIEFDTDSDPDRTVACFPLVGAIVGFGAYLTAALCSLLIVSDVLAAAVATIAITLAAEIVSGNGEISLLAAVLNLRMKGVPISELRDHPDTRIVFDGTLSLMIFISLYLIKLICVGLLVFHSESSWFIAVFALGYLFRAKLAVSERTRFSRPIIEVDDPSLVSNLCWLTAGGSVLLGGLTSFPAPLLILIISYLLFKGYDYLCEKLGIDVSELIVDIHGAAADLFFLLLITSLIAR